MSVGRVTAKTKIYEIKIELREVRPAVLRRVQVPGELSLAGLHAVVQVAMGWTDSHLHEPGHPARSRGCRLDPRLVGTRPSSGIRQNRRQVIESATSRHRVS